MKYFPKSRVLTNQKADQNQFKTSDGKPYTGPYYTTFKGESFSGVSPTSGSSSPLYATPISQAGLTLGIDGIAKAQYNQLNPTPINLVDPTPFTPRPTDADYAAGKITRYFARQRNGTTFRLMEIDQPTYEAFTKGRGNANTALWKVVSIFWQISGPLYNERVNGIQTRAGVIDTNQRILDNTEPNFIGIKQYLTDLTQFYKPV
jgi:hypothetical protein